MSYEQAKNNAQRYADRTGNSVLVYKATHREGIDIYGFSCTLPMWGERIGDRLYPTTSEASGFDNNCQ